MKNAIYISIIAGTILLTGCQTTSTTDTAETKPIEVIYPVTSTQPVIVKAKEEKIQPKVEVKETAKKPEIIHPVIETKPTVVAEKPAPVVAKKEEKLVEPKVVASVVPEKTEVDKSKAAAKSEKKSVKQSKKYHLRIISLPSHDYYSKVANKIVDHMKKTKN